MPLQVAVNQLINPIFHAVKKIHKCFKGAISLIWWRALRHFEGVSTQYSAS